jgi:hypothetical protein
VVSPRSLTAASPTCLSAPARTWPTCSTTSRWTVDCPRRSGQYETVVIDTLDAYQRKLKNEWLEANKKESFSGWEAWGFLDQKMQLLLTKLLNLDVNIVIAAHYKDKVTRTTTSRSHELMLQLSGDIKDTAYNDFDLVGWMGTYWEAVAGERIEKRGITFKRTPDKPF